MSAALAVSSAKVYLDIWKAFYTDQYHLSRAYPLGRFQRFEIADGDDWPNLQVFVGAETR